MSRGNMPPVSSVLITDRTFDKATTLKPEKLSVFSCPLNLHSTSSIECNQKKKQPHITLLDWRLVISQI